MGKAPQALFIGGARSGIAERDLAAEHGGQRSGDPWTDHWSLALMVHPLDVPRYRREAREKRLNVTIRNNGIVEFRSHSDQKRYAKAYGYANYGDYY